MASQVVPQAIPASLISFSLFFRTIFSHNQLPKFQQYLTGLVVNDDHNVLSLSQFIDRTASYDNLHHFVSESTTWSPDHIADKAVEMIQKDKHLKSVASGWLVIDDVLIVKTGKRIEFVGKLFDHSEHRYIDYAHCLVNLWYVDARGIGYPLKTELYIKKNLADESHPFRTKHEIARELVQWAHDKGVACQGVLFDGWYLNKKTTTFVEGLAKSWVSRMKSDMLIKQRRHDISCGAHADTLTESQFTESHIKGRQYRYYSKCFKVPALKRKVRLVFVQEWNKKKKVWGELVILATNEVTWHSDKIIKNYRLRWSIETFHRDAKQHLGFGEYQMRRLHGISRHWSLVFVSYLYLVKVRRSSRLVRSLEQQQQTIGSLCSFVKDHVTELLVRWVHEQCQQQQSLDDILAQLKLNQSPFLIGNTL